MLRHEQQSIRMALATVMHHSFKVHTEYGAPRSQTTATRAREGEVREQHYGLRAQERGHVLVVSVNRDRSSQHKLCSRP